MSTLRWPSVRTGRKLDVAADFAAALGYSAFRLGGLGGVCAHSTGNARDDLRVPPSTSRGAGIRMSEMLRTCAVHGSPMSGLDGLLELTGHVFRSSLIFLLSDFHWPLASLHRWLDALAPAHVVPVVIWDRAETERPSGTICLRFAMRRRAVAEPIGCGTP